jgi:dTDP-4-dehydrorhamnose 3,5-epimerase-like enzyme
VYVITGQIHDFYFSVEAQFNRVIGPGEFVVVPAGAAHGFRAIEDSDVLYLLEECFDPVKDRNIFWQTPEWNIPKFDNVIMSQKDRDASYWHSYDYLVLRRVRFSLVHIVFVIYEKLDAVF